MTRPLLDFRSHRRRLLDEALAESGEAFDGRVLDVGGGRERGRFTRRPDGDWVVLDVEADHRPTVLGDAARLPFDDASVDAVKCTEVLEHLRHPEQAVEEMARVLRPDGRLVLSMPFLYGIHGDPNDYQRYTESKLRDLLADQFDVQRFEAQGAFFTVVAYLFQRAIINARSGWKRLAYPLLPLLDAVAALDRLGPVRRSPYYQSFTTGYFVVARKCDVKRPANERGVSVQ